MAKLLHWFGVGCLACALLGVGTLLVSDARNAFQLTELHRHAGALCFILIGAAYIAVLLSFRRPFKTAAKGIALGIAFILWGCESFIPTGRGATAIDSIVIVIFVTDLSWTILQRLKVATAPGICKPAEPRHRSDADGKIIGTELANGLETLNTHEPMP